MKQTMKSLKAFFCIMLVLFSMVCMVPAASAISYGFPLPGGKKYDVTALNKYSGGSYHKSYINEYILKKGSKPTNNVIDIAADKNTPIYAIADGTVIVNTYGDGGGNYVVIRHSLGNGKYSYSYYGHMIAKSPCAKNSKVKKGQQIGKVGKTGKASGYHLHFEMSDADPYCMFESHFRKLSLAAAKYPHHHKCTSFKGCGECKVCGKVFDYKVTRMNRKALITACINSCSKPYSAASTRTQINTRKLVKVVGKTVNAYGETWYRIEWSASNATKTGWVKSTNVKLR